VESGEAGDEVVVGRGGCGGRAEEERRRHEGEQERGWGGHGGDVLEVVAMWPRLRRLRRQGGSLIGRAGSQ
jgi:hypothetical protein